MKKILMASAAAGLLLSSTAFAAESVEMLRITPEGVGGSVGTVVLEQTDAGVVATISVDGMAPGVQRLRMVEETACQPVGLNMPYQELTFLYTGIDEDGALPTRASAVIPDVTLEQLHGKALVIMNGGQFADQQNAMTGLPSQAACGIVPAN